METLQQSRDTGEVVHGNRSSPETLSDPLTITDLHALIA